MLETRAIVVAIKDLSASVVVNQASGCEQCNGKGCASSKVAQLFCQQTATFEVLNHVHAKVGDEVMVAVQDGALFQGILVLYLLPLFTLIVAATFANYWINAEFLIALLAIIGLLLGFLGVKIVARQLQPKQPYIQSIV